MLVYQRVSDFFPWEFLWMAHWHTPRKHESPKFGFGIWFSFGRCIHCWQNLYKISLFNPHFPDFKRSQNQIHAVSIQSPTVSICFAIFSHVFRHVLPYLSHQNLHEIHEKLPSREALAVTVDSVTATCEAVQRWRDLCIGVFSNSTLW